MLIVQKINMLFNTPRSSKELVNKSDFRDVVLCILVRFKNELSRYSENQLDCRKIILAAPTVVNESLK